MDIETRVARTGCESSGKAWVKVMIAALCHLMVLDRVCLAIGAAVNGPSHDLKRALQSQKLCGWLLTLWSS